VIEHDVLGRCVDNDVSIVCYSPMAQGILSGKFRGPTSVPPQRKRARYCRDDVIKLTFEVVRHLSRVSREIGEPMASVALAWVLAQPGVTSVVAGARTVTQVGQNACAANLKLPRGHLDRLADVSQRLKAALDTNPDMWQEGADSRYR
jgi:aryl-alcohol dehydrogenase-like predicted oxidoreductase